MRTKPKSAMRVALETSLPDLKKGEKLTYYLKKDECVHITCARIRQTLANMVPNGFSYASYFGVSVQSDKVGHAIHILRPDCHTERVWFTRSPHKPRCV